MFSGGGYSSKPGDWRCGHCRYTNFASRKRCNRCNADKDDLATDVSPDDHEETNQDCSGGRKKCPSSRPGERKKRDHPIGFLALQSLLEKTPDQIVMELLRERSGYSLMIEDPSSISIDKMCLTMKVLALGTTTRSNRESLNMLLTRTLQPKFVNHLQSFSLNIFLENVYPVKVVEYFENLWIILTRFAYSMPNLAVDRIFVLLEGCVIYMKQQSNKEMVDLIKKYEEIRLFLENEKKKWKSHEQRRSKFKNQYKDHLHPPENFRELPVIPTPGELNSPDEPFLRRSITHGKYDNVEHYLDVQFRLLREDFVRPLRSGIKDFKYKIKSKNRDLFIYKDVRIVGTNVKNFTWFHNVKLRLPANFKAENSKRLLYGNLVCLSSNNFRTVVFGSVAERSSEMIKKGILGIKFDSDIKNFANHTFVMAESKSYFTAYKHVLKALQKVTEDIFPMEEFIVHVNSDIPLPDYVTAATEYDLRVMRNKTMMKMNEVHNDLFQQRRKLFNQELHTEIHSLRRVPIAQNIMYWPSCEDLGVDESQQRALRSALTKKLTIIQGPPGTGKTFLGLKIAQALLHNSHYWKLDDKAPILVVCYTNHALDQFLEGMIHFTQSIVRVGSRTKSELIQPFQINTLLQDLRSNRKMPAEIHQNKIEIMEKLNEIEARIKPGRQMVCELNEPIGILKLDCLLQHKVIPDRIVNFFKKYDLKMYLLDTRFLSHVNETSYSSSRNGRSKSNYDDDDDFWEDAEDYYAEEEDMRRLLEDFEYGKPFVGMPKHTMRYSITLEGLEENIDKLYKKKEKASVVQVLRYEREIADLEDQWKLLKYGLNIVIDNERSVHLEQRNMLELNMEERWMMYKLWLLRIAEKVTPDLLELTPDLLELEEEYEQNTEVYNEIKNQQYLHIMSHAAVVGMTTTGAAQHSDVLHSLAPPIVIIEEAAEILEAHVITALTEECKHLIMIGDHQQLQPSATVYELAKDYGLETSLFERLIKNDIAYETLEYQHRMRPSISRLLVPSIYEHLKDHESVHNYPHIKGMQRDVFFATHKYCEDKVGDENNSKENMHEANLIMTLCRHLMLQGYSSNDITVLTPYTGQFFLLKKIQRYYEECQGVRISVVDNFQGEESNIILLSLVRSNEAGAVGFLRTENRICVALSRAKHGLYVTGNMKQLRDSCELWKNIFKDLNDDGSIGSAFVLQCKNHPEVLSPVTTGRDILEKSPEGGCTKPCSFTLPRCGHKCPKVCHLTDLEHVCIKCQVPCPKIICERRHRCPKKCWEECMPCIELVEKVLPCNHIHQVLCHTFDTNHKCPTIVERTLPHCGHKANMKCCENPSTFKCPVACDIRLPCGHKCTRTCHVLDDPKHLKYQCQEPCPRSPEGCSKDHKCEKSCYENCGPCVIMIKKRAPCGHVLDAPCSQPKEEMVCNGKCRRMLPCGHFCPRKCQDLCGGCKVKVVKKIQECQHEIEVECGQPALRANCNHPCTLKLCCGHPCKATCREKCTVLCKVRVPSTYRCPKGHSINVPCYYSKIGIGNEEDAWYYCRKPCNAELECGHICKGTCGTCLQGRLHVSCGEQCGKTLVCGHICKAGCSAACPPCQEPCPMRCVHSRCGQKCGEFCSPCQEKCSRSCIHQQCKNPCGKECTKDLCEEPCKKKLKCGHYCVGYCGDPCPPLCRICDKEELTQIIFGTEDEDDARFVLLEDCGHVIEASGLKEWLAQDSEEIGMRSCPLCKKPIYSNRRNHAAILKSYENVRHVKKLHYRKAPSQAMQELGNLLKEMEGMSGKEVDEIRQRLPEGTSYPVQQIYHTLTDNQISLYSFQIQVLKKLDDLMADNQDQGDRLKGQVRHIKKNLMRENYQVSSQMVEDVTCEIQRLQILPAYWKFVELKKVKVCAELVYISNKLKPLMFATVRFSKSNEMAVKKLLKSSERFIGGLGITDGERISIINAMGFKQGHWYKCPNNHIYCIADCGGAMEVGNCPECGAAIGGTNHNLRSDNRVATEMDGATHPAWSEHYNNMGNFHFDDIDN